MQATPTFSIILLTYNGQRLIEERLNELWPLYGGRDDVEIVVLDNGSGDGTMLAIASFSMSRRIQEGRLVHHRIVPNIGFGPGFNAAVRLSRGKIVILQSNDVRVHGDILAPLAAGFEKHGKGAVLCHRLVDWNAGWNCFDGTFFPYPDGYILAMSRETWDVLGGFDEDLRPVSYEDVDIGYRAAQAGHVVAAVPEMPVFHIGAQTAGYGDSRYEQTCRMRAIFAGKHNLPNVPERP